MSTNIERTRLASLPTHVKRKMPDAQMPLEYEEACRALAACRTIDESKYWSDKADALAAWAKIYKHQQASVEAKRLKLHAYRRMGVLATEVYSHPDLPGNRQPHPGRNGHRAGVPKALKEAGLKQHEADWASAIAKMPEEKFNATVNSPKPPAPGSLMPTYKGSTDAWKTLAGAKKGGYSMLGFRGFCRIHDPRDLAAGLSSNLGWGQVSETGKAREMAVEIMDWIDEFERHLPSA